MISTNQPVVQLSNITRRHPDGRVCPRDVSLQLYPGELVLITGGNGTGKSSLLKILSLFDLPTEGQMTIFGKDIRQLKSRQINNIQGYIEYVPQKDFGLQKGSALENVVHLLEYEMPSNKAKSKARTLLDQVQTAQKFDINKEIAKLSGGEQARVAIAIALGRNLPLCLVDEIFADIDQESYVPLLDLFRQLTQQGTTVVIISHVPGLEGNFDRVLTLKNYTVIEDQRKFCPDFEGTHSMLIPAPKNDFKQPWLKALSWSLNQLGIGVTLPRLERVPKAKLYSIKIKSGCDSGHTWTFRSHP
jgi:ABC-type lipoprotein export system ATPase subunit